MRQALGHGLRTPAVLVWWAATVAVLLVAGPVAPLRAEPCRVTLEQDRFTFPVEHLEPAALCLIEPIVNRPTTSGSIGPITAPIPQALYAYLLDHPVITAALVERLGLGTYQFTVKGQGQFWGNDGDGTQGLLTLLYQDQTARLYHIDGYHEGHLFPMVRAKAVVFLRVAPMMTTEGHPAVETSLVAYTRLNDPVLSALLSLLTPLVGETVVRKLTKAFDATTQLGMVMAKEPARLIQEVNSLPMIQPDDQRVLTSLLQGLPQPVRLPAP